MKPQLLSDIITAGTESGSVLSQSQKNYPWYKNKMHCGQGGGRVSGDEVPDGAQSDAGFRYFINE